LRYGPRHTKLASVDDSTRGVTHLVVAAIRDEPGHWREPLAAPVSGGGDTESGYLGVRSIIDDAILRRGHATARSADFAYLAAVAVAANGIWVADQVTATAMTRIAPEVSDALLTAGVGSRWAVAERGRPARSLIADVGGPETAVRIARARRPPGRATDTNTVTVGARRLVLRVAAAII
jgi:hypothetical protein